jgi:hypothetical protein
MRALGGSRSVTADGRFAKQRNRFTAFLAVKALQRFGRFTKGQTQTSRGSLAGERVEHRGFRKGSAQRGISPAIA